MLNDVPVRIWDLPVRAFHWLLAGLFGFLVFSGKVGGNWMEYHVYAGYSVLALVVFRVLWGFAGSTHARFSNFLTGPSRVLAYARRLLSAAPSPSAGHNPIGGWMVIVVLACLLLQGGTGLFSNDDIAFEGPLYPFISKSLSDRLTSLHRFNADLLIVLVATHIAAVLFHALVKKENLVRAMFTGVKRLPAGLEGTQGLRVTSNWLALVLVAASFGAVYLVVTRPI